MVGGNGLIGKAVVGRFDELGYKVKVADLPDFDMAHPYVIRDFLPCDIFVNTAYPKDVYTHIMDYAALSECVAESMKVSGGSIVHLGSIYGVVAPKAQIYQNTQVPETPLWYSAAKGAIISFTRWLAAKYAPSVRVNCVSPGGVFDNQDPEFVRRYCERVPMKCMATPDDVAKAIAFLAGSDASYITGHNLMVDGGLSIW